MMLLDTHVILWLGESPGHLSAAARLAIRQNETERPMISALSLYEIAWGVLRGRIESSLPIDELLLDIRKRFDVLPVTPAIATTAAQLPAAFPSDPFDRIIAATAITQGVPLITADQRIRRSKALRTLW